LKKASAMKEKGSRAIGGTNTPKNAHNITIAPSFAEISRLGAIRV
jgi:hypothetical protein